MPIYEYVCSQCGERFEKIILRPQAEESLRCPRCESPEVQRAVSAFATLSCVPTPSGFR
ncbi:MAG: zinc ribbon domain-containing protein [Chloroflexi bacterium]|nr:zinc ribbon domain-containing protein [Chloroflexota bacterium]